MYLRLRPCSSVHDSEEEVLWCLWRKGRCRSHRDHLSLDFPFTIVLFFVWCYRCALSELVHASDEIRPEGSSSSDPIAPFRSLDLPPIIFKTKRKQIYLWLMGSQNTQCIRTWSIIFSSRVELWPICCQCRKSGYR